MMKILSVKHWTASTVITALGKKRRKNKKPQAREEESVSKSVRHSPYKCKDPCLDLQDTCKKASMETNA